MVFGQDMIADSLEINRIDCLVNEIKNDSSLKMISLDDIKLLNRFNKKTYHTVYVQLKNDKIVHIYLTDSSQIPRFGDFKVTTISLIRTRYFINDDDLIYTEEYYGHTRNKLYYKNANIIKVVNNDFVINNDDVLNDIIKNKEQIYKNFNKIYKVSKRKIK
ncbi:hypothetical protein [Avrilella dinanensis]|uniref:Uncharacterized protein n=1 Tax=Avrilella dinanensis TaxID=2008672 RepID=A0A2M9R6F8_9FLAO|nr:hypothetical protein [Avrilella dinanensis]PJR04303.1 hypothetical protein CDL10_06975 [Avrilella dinanensis]